MHNFIMDSKNGIRWEPGAYQELLGMMNYYLKQEPEYFKNVNDGFNKKHNIDVVDMLKIACSGKLI